MRADVNERRGRVREDLDRPDRNSLGPFEDQDFGPYGRGENQDYTYDRGYYTGRYYADRSNAGAGYMGYRPYAYGADRGPAPAGDLGRTSDGQFPSARDRYFNNPDQDRVGYEMYGNRDLVRRSHGNAYGSSPGMGGATGEYAALMGEHAGKGPRNHVPDDRRITEDVCDELTWHGDIDASEVNVRSEGGEVTLEGTVPDRRHKRLAEDLALGVRGVRDVNNHLRIA